MQSEVVSQIAMALRHAATHRGLLSYKRFHKLFEPREPKPNRMLALEKALESLDDTSSVDYGALLALDNGLPGPEFFSRFRRNHRDEYFAVMGWGSCGQSVIRKKIIATAERARVYEHARRR